MQHTHPMYEEVSVPKDRVRAGACRGWGCLRYWLTCASIQAKSPLLVPTDHMVAGLLGAGASEGGQPQHLCAKLGILGHPHTMLSVQEHRQIVIKTYH